MVTSTFILEKIISRVIPYFVKDGPRTSGYVSLILIEDKAWELYESIKNQAYENAKYLLSIPDIFNQSSSDLFDIVNYELIKQTDKIQEARDELERVGNLLFELQDYVDICTNFIDNITTIEGKLQIGEEELTSSSLPLEAKQYISNVFRIFKKQIASTKKEAISRKESLIKLNDGFSLDPISSASTYNITRKIQEQRVTINDLCTEEYSKYITKINTAAYKFEQDFYELKSREFPDSVTEYMQGDLEKIDSISNDIKNMLMVFYNSCSFEYNIDFSGTFDPIFESIEEAFGFFKALSANEMTDIENLESLYVNQLADSLDTLQFTLNMSYKQLVIFYRVLQIWVFSTVNNLPAYRNSVIENIGVVSSFVEDLNINFLGNTYYCDNPNEVTGFDIIAETSQQYHDLLVNMTNPDIEGIQLILNNFILDGVEQSLLESMEICQSYLSRQYLYTSDQNTIDWLRDTEHQLSIVASDFHWYMEQLIYLRSLASRRLNRPLDENWKTDEKASVLLCTQFMVSFSNLVFNYQEQVSLWKSLPQEEIGKFNLDFMPNISSLYKKILAFMDKAMNLFEIYVSITNNVPYVKRSIVSNPLSSQQINIPAIDNFIANRETIVDVLQRLSGLVNTPNNLINHTDTVDLPVYVYALYESNQLIKSINTSIVLNECSKCSGDVQLQKDMQRIYNMRNSLSNVLYNTNDSVNFNDTRDILNNLIYLRNMTMEIAEKNTLMNLSLLNIDW